MGRRDTRTRGWGAAPLRWPGSCCFQLVHLSKGTAAHRLLSQLSTFYLSRGCSSPHSITVPVTTTLQHSTAARLGYPPSPPRPSCSQSSNPSCPSRPLLPRHQVSDLGTSTTPSDIGNSSSVDRGHLTAISFGPPDPICCRLFSLSTSALSCIQAHQTSSPTGVSIADLVAHHVERRRQQPVWE